MEELHGIDSKQTTGQVGGKWAGGRGLRAVTDIAKLIWHSQRNDLVFAASPQALVFYWKLLPTNHVRAALLQ